MRNYGHSKLIRQEKMVLWVSNYALQLAKWTAFEKINFNSGMVWLAEWRYAGSILNRNSCFFLGSSKAASSGFP